MTQPTFSFEIFPPNTEAGNDKIFKTLSEMKGLTPDYISVTASNRRLDDIETTTLKLASHIKHELGISSIAHLPAIHLTKQKVCHILDELDKLEVYEVLALRGDILPDVAPEKDFQYASDLIAFIKAYAPHFKIIGACYPEVHPESSNQVVDIKNLKKKVSVGCSRLVSQLFFDNETFYDFRDKCLLADVEVPLVAGIMPIINRNQALRLVKTNQTKLPKKFKAILDKYEHDPDSLRAAGLAYAVDQIVDLVTQDVAGIHLYTMNNAETARHISEVTGPLFRRNS